MFTGTFARLFRLSMIIISVVLLVVTMIGTNAVSAQTLLLTQDGSIVGVPAPLDPAKISFQEIASGLTKPVFITNAGDGSGRIFVIEQAGYIRILKNGSLLGTPFLDIHTIIKSGGEQGLIALAFHPSYSTNGIFFVAYTAPRSGDAIGSDLILERFSVSANNPDLANSGSGVVLLTIGHPAYSNHNGGTLAFGGDGYLYWSTGDGGGGGDPSNNALQLNNLLGKILRIDVNSGSPYGIPTSNPFYSSADPNVRKEIWAYGLRNPWRLSFDRLTHDLYIADVGQSAREEVDFQLASSTGGENYGWREMEGSICYNPSSGCDQSGKILPVAEYNHTLGCSITGGYVYRGLKFPSLTGYYFYGDYCSGRLFSLYNDPSLGWTAVQLVDTPYSVSTFGEDEQGELYLANLGAGKLYNIQYQEGPTVTSILRANTNPTPSASVGFTVSFSKSVTGVDAGDFIITTTGGVSGATVSGVSGAGSVYTIAVNTGSGDGTIRLDVVNNNTIKDAALIPLLAGFTSGETYTIDKTAPVVVSSLRVNANPASASSVNFTVTFSESVTGVEVGDFVITTTGDISGTSVSGVSGAGSVYTVTVNTGSDDGTLRLDVPASATINDLASNPLANLPFTSGDTYTVNKPPRAAALTAPIGNINNDYNPNYSWGTAATATNYRLYVAGPSGVVIDQWYEASLICDTTTCSVTPGPSAALIGGTYSWYVQTYNPAGYGPWSNNTQPTNFTTTIPAVPAAAVLSYPAQGQSIGTDYTPSYTWGKVDTATYYRLYVSGPSGVVLDQWYSSASICATSTCSVVSPTLAGGTYSWYVQAYNPIGYGPWSNNTQPTNFNTSTTPPVAAVLTEPKGSIGTNFYPIYKWGKVDTATYYRLYVSGPSGVVLDQWYQASVICPTAECAVPSPMLGVGAYAWYVQTYSPAGYGPWSNNTQPTNFNTTLPALPVAAVLTEPIGNILENYTPSYKWGKVPDALYYRLYVSGPSGLVLDQWYQASVICDTPTLNVCSVTSPLLGGGDYVWYVQTWNHAGYGPWSNNTQPTNFNTSTTPPVAAILTEPKNDIGTNYTPPYKWGKVSTATHYRLYVSGPSGVVLDQWYQASVICPTAVCSVTSPTLVGGNYVWYVQTYSPAGYGPWSNNTQPTNFNTTIPSVPAAAVLTYPAQNQNIGTDYNPTYSWGKVAAATHYRLYVSGPGGVVLDQWYLASSICPAATCTVVSPTLGGGAHIWYVQTYNSSGYGPWSNNVQPTNFNTTIPTIPAGAVMTAPSGTITSHTPSYQWNRVNMATWYRLYVKGPSGLVKDQWYQAITVCNATTCSVAGPTLESGDHIWWIQTYNTAGYGPWKKGIFTISP